MKFTSLTVVEFNNLQLQSTMASSSMMMFASYTGRRLKSSGFSASRGARVSKIYRFSSVANNKFSNDVSEVSCKYYPLMLQTMPFSVRV